MITVNRKCDLPVPIGSYSVMPKSRFILSPALATYLLRPGKKQR